MKFPLWIWFLIAALLPLSGTVAILGISRKLALQDDFRRAPLCRMAMHYAKADRVMGHFASMPA